MTRAAVLLMLSLSLSCNRRHAYKVEELSAAGNRACAALHDGSVRCWGQTPSGPQTTPKLAVGFTDAASVCVGDGFVCARSGTGHASCDNGALNAEGVTAIACGRHHVCVIVGGHVRCGADDVGGTAGAVSLAAGGDKTCAVFGDGSLRCWDVGKPPTLVPLLNVASVAVGDEHVCAVLRDETVACFGANDDGQLGTGDRIASATPRPVRGVDIAKQVACGAHHTCARMGDSTVHCWGKNDVHQAAVTTATHILEQTLVPGLYEAESVAAGDDFTCVRMSDGWLRCFGVNDWGQLADGTTVIRNVPTPIRY